MNVEKLSAIAELISSVAVVVTLGYLAIQTQQNTTAIQASVRQAMLTDDREMLLNQIEFPVVVTGRTGSEDLTDEELVQVAASLVAFVRVKENQWLQYQNGVIDEETWSTYKAPIPLVLSTDFCRSWWRNRSGRGEFDEGFVTMVNATLGEQADMESLSLRERLGFDPVLAVADDDV